MKRPRILFLDQSGQLGGAELCLADIAAAFHPDSLVMLFADGPFRIHLESLGIRVETCALDANAAAVSKSGGISSVARAAPGLLRLVQRIVRRARAFDLIYANTAKAAVIGSIAAKLARRPVVVHLHDILSAEHFSTINRLALVAAASGADRIVANSQATADAYRAAGGRNPNVSVIPNGFDLARFPIMDAAARADLRASLRLDDAFTVGVFGRLSPWKGQHLLLEALREFPGARAIVVGDALFTTDDRAYRDRLKAIAAEPGLAGRVSFLGFRNDTHALMQAVDVVVHTSTAPEPLGRVVVEGMLAARPVVAPDTGGPREIISHRKTGLLIPPNDPHALARSLLELDADPPLREALGRSARATAQADYGIDSVMERLSTALDGVARRG